MRGTFSLSHLLFSRLLVQSWSQILVCACSCYFISSDVHAAFESWFAFGNVILNTFLFCLIVCLTSSICFLLLVHKILLSLVIFDYVFSIHSSIRPFSLYSMSSGLISTKHLLHFGVDSQFSNEFVHVVCMMLIINTRRRTSLADFHFSLNIEVFQHYLLFSDFIDSWYHRRIVHFFLLITGLSLHMYCFCQELVQSTRTGRIRMHVEDRLFCYVLRNRSRCRKP